MTQRTTAGRQAREPRLLVCGFGHFPGVPENPAGLIAERLGRGGWAPEGAGADYLILPTTWGGAFATLEGRLGGETVHGVLLVGVAVGAERFRVETRAQNRARTGLADAAGAFHPSPTIAPLGPAAARATAPVEPMVAALEQAGLPAHASSDAGDYLCNYTFYRLLTEAAARPQAPLAAFLHLPPEGAFSFDDLERGVKVAASTLARTVAFGLRADAALT